MNVQPHGIVVYPNRLKLLGLAALGAMFFVPILLLRGSAHAQADLRTLFVTFCGLPFFGILMGFFLARALRPSASFVVNEDGITDRVSGVWPGDHFVPWSNIVALVSFTTRPTHTFWKQRRLLIVLRDLTPERRRFLAKSHWRAAVAAKMMRMAGGPHLFIPQPYLAMPIPDLLHEIERRYPAQLHQYDIVVDAGD